MPAIPRLAPRAELLAIVQYDPDTGRFVWRARPRSFFQTQRHCSVWNARYEGREAFTALHSAGYLFGSLFNRRVFAHRLAWKITHDDEPAEIDHLNGVRVDNRITNLRGGGRSENARNCGKPSTNKSGFVGVTWDTQRQKWYASIRDRGSTLALGRFPDLESAVQARREAETRLGYSKRHGR